MDNIFIAPFHTGVSTHNINMLLNIFSIYLSTLIVYLVTVKNKTGLHLLKDINVVLTQVVFFQIYLSNYICRFYYFVVSIKLIACAYLHVCTYQQKPTRALIKYDKDIFSNNNKIQWTTKLLKETLSLLSLDDRAEE